MSELKFSIITPTILRPSLVKLCESIHSQSYSNWRHLIAVDLCNADLTDYTQNHSDLLKTNRQWFRCPVTHHNMGNSCRKMLFENIENDTDYILYMDDDNFYVGETLSLLNEELQKQGCPDWGIFPMSMCDHGEKFCSPEPRKNFADANQLFHKPYINVPCHYQDIDDYGADGVLIDFLNTLTRPTILNTLPSLVSYPVRSRGAAAAKDWRDLQSYAVVIPHKYEDIIRPLITSFKEFEPASLKVVIIADGHDRNYGYDIIKTEGRFNFSRAANLGINHFPQDDIILMNDDIRLIQPSTFMRLRDIAYSHPQIGMVTPTIDGGGYLHVDCHNQAIWKDGETVYETNIIRDKADFVPFAIAYLKRSMLNDIGLLDEGFINYGGDDVDMNVRALAKGWKCVVAKEITVRHGSGMANFGKGKSYSMSFTRNPMVGNLEYFLKKYPNLTNNYLTESQKSQMVKGKGNGSKDRMKFIRTNPLNKLVSSSSWKTRIAEAKLRSMRRATV
jgi:glycosyltransferase involved in cell wall biosynthesis